MSKRTVRIVGNAPTAEQGVTADFDGIYIGLNAAPLVFAKHSVRCDICWVQDWRFFLEKRDKFKTLGDALKQTSLYTLDEVDAFGIQFKERKVIQRLGRNGFSRNPEVGIFEGYTSAYGAMQLALAFAPSHVELYGVDFTYGLASGRFYQTRPGWDLDLHVHGKQIGNTRHAIRQLQQAGVKVSVCTPSLIGRMIDGQPLTLADSR